MKEPHNFTINCKVCGIEHWRTGSLQDCFYCSSQTNDEFINDIITHIEDMSKKENWNESLCFRCGDYFCGDQYDKERNNKIECHKFKPIDIDTDRMIYILRQLNDFKGKKDFTSIDVQNQLIIPFQRMAKRYRHSINFIERIYLGINLLVEYDIDLGILKD